MPTKTLESIRRELEYPRAAPSLNELGDADSTAPWIAWFEALLTLQDLSLSASDHHQPAVDALVNLVGLDEGVMLERESEKWQVVASAAKSGRPTEHYCPELLEKLVAERITFFESKVRLNENEVANGAEIKAYVAAPILDGGGELVGVLFGTKFWAHAVTADPSGSFGIRRIESCAVQWIAGMVAAGMIRATRQADASRFEVQLEQFASPSLVKAMKHDPNVLDAREREITVLFSDIRGFTGLTERVGAEKTFLMIRNLMNQLTRCILDEEGFIMSYSGDGIAAMWNAPANQPDHAELACWAAVNMQVVMSKLSQFWNFITGEVLEARVGIATGNAHVGNAGSRWRLHYSALGPSVNLASRLEGANKFFETSILIGESTKQRLFSRFDLRRIGPVMVKGIDQVEQVYALQPGEPGVGTNSAGGLDSEAKCSAKSIACYADALELFEGRRFAEAIELIEAWERANADSDAAVQVLKSASLRMNAAPPDELVAIRLTEK